MNRAESLPVNPSHPSSDSRRRDLARVCRADGEHDSTSDTTNSPASHKLTIGVGTGLKADTDDGNYAGNSDGIQPANLVCNVHVYETSDERAAIVSRDERSNQSRI